MADEELGENDSSSSDSSDSDSSSADEEMEQEEEDALLKKLATLNEQVHYKYCNLPIPGLHFPRILLLA